MSKILSILFVSFFLCLSAAFGQNTPAEYSESVAYQPRLAETVVPVKKKDKKKSKKDSDDVKTPPVIETVSPANPSNSVKTIRIPLFVYDKSGNPVADLQAADVKVLVDDAEREIASFETIRAPRDILLFLDTSPSLAYDEKDLRSAVLKLIEALQPGDNLQIIGFNSEVRIISEKTSDPAVLKKAVNKIKLGDGTSIYDATQEVFRNYLSGKTAPPVVILLTDGVDTTSQKFNFVTSLVEAERTGAVVFPFYFDSSELMATNLSRFPPGLVGALSRSSAGKTKDEYAVGRAFVQDIAALSGGRAFVIKSLAKVGRKDFEAALKFVNPQYYLSINSTETIGKVERKQVKVRVMRPNLSVYARGSYLTGAK